MFVNLYDQKKLYEADKLQVAENDGPEHFDPEDFDLDDVVVPANELLGYGSDA